MYKHHRQTGGVYASGRPACLLDSLCVLCTAVLRGALTVLVPGGTPVRHHSDQESNHSRQAGCFGRAACHSASRREHRSMPVTEAVAVVSACARPYTSYVLVGRIQQLAAYNQAFARLVVTIPAHQSPGCQRALRHDARLNDER